MPVSLLSIRTVVQGGERENAWRVCKSLPGLNVPRLAGPTATDTLAGKRCIATSPAANSALPADVAFK